MRKLNKGNISRWIVALSLLAAVVASTAYLLMLGWYNTLLLDDYGMVADVDKTGAFGLMKEAYIGWQSRFSGFLVLGWIFEIWGHASNLVTYTLMMLILGYCTLYYALKNIMRISNKWLLYGISIIVTNVSVMAYLEISTFYWMCCAIYTLSTYAAIALMTSIFFDDGQLWKRWLIVILCSLYLCGGAENFTPLVIVMLSVAWLYKIIQLKDWHFWRNEEQTMAFVSMIVLLIGFIAVIAGPGTKSRALEGSSRGFMEHFEVVPYMTQLVKASIIFFLRLFSRSLYYLLLFPIGMMLGSNLKEYCSIEVEHKGRGILLSAIAAFGLIEISIAATVYGTGWYASLRAYSFVSFILAFSVIYWGILIGHRYTKKTIETSAIIAYIIVAAMSIYSYRIELPLVAHIHNQIEIRHNQIYAANQINRTKPLVIEKIEYPHIPNTYAILRKMINTMRGKENAKISAPNEYFPYERYALCWKSEDFRSKGVQRYFNVPFDIIGWENPN